MVSTLDPVTEQEPLAQEPETLTPERLREENRHHDRILGWLLLIAVFLLASFPVADPEIWSHLRTGQMIWQGEFSWGEDPYSYTTTGRTWVHHGWLADLILWVVYNAFGGAGLVLLRGFIMVTTAALLWRLQRPGGNGLVAVFALGLALVAMGPRQYLRPELFSVLMLAATLFILAHPPVESATGLLDKLLRPMRGRLYLFLVPLFLVWVNLDAWFILGPLTVGLWWLGAWIQEKTGGDPGTEDWADAPERRALAIAGLASLAVCVLNPWHIFAFQLPADLASPMLSMLQEQKSVLKLNRILRPWLSPWQAEYFAESRVDSMSQSYYYGLSPAEWFYYPLAILCILCLFARSWRGNRTWVPLMLVVFVLGAYQARNAAFFAVVAGPFLLLGLQDLLRRRQELSTPDITRWPVLRGQLARMLALLVLTVLVLFQVWPFPAPRPNRSGEEVPRGWVHPLGSMGWSIRPDLSVEHAMRQLHAWKASKQLPGQSFLLDWFEHPDYQAYFDPYGKHFLDRRFGLYSPETVKEFTEAFDALRNSKPLRRVLLETYRNEAGTGFFAAAYKAHTTVRNRQEKWQGIFRKYGITHLVLSHRDVLWEVGKGAQPERMSLEESLDLEMDLTRDGNAGKVWQTLGYLDGQTFVLGWAKMLPAATLKTVAYNPEKLVFKTEVTDAERAAWAKEPLPVVRETFWTGFMAGNVPVDPHAYDKAERHLFGAMFQVSANAPNIENTRWLGQHVVQTLASSAGAAAGRPWTPFVDAFALQVRFTPSPAEAILAVRDARRALLETPGGAPLTAPQRGRVYYMLAQAYLSLYQADQLTGNLNRLESMRDYQYLCALKQSVDLTGENAAGKLELIREYTKRGQWDIALMMYQEALQTVSKQPPPMVEDRGTLRPRNEKELERWPREREFQLWARISQPGILNFNPQQLESLIKERQLLFARQVAGMENRPLDRALVAVQLNLITNARQELDTAEKANPIQSEADAVKVFQINLEIAYRLGDLPLLMQLLQDPRRPMSQIVFQAYAAAGNYDEAERVFQELDKGLKGMTAEKLLIGGETRSLGGAVTAPNLTLWREAFGTLFTSQSAFMEAGVLNDQRTRLRVQAGMLALEAGKLNLAREHFHSAMTELNPLSSYRPLAGHYYIRLTDYPEK